MGFIIALLFSEFLKESAELLEALQNLTSNDNEDIRIKSRQILDCFLLYSV